MELALSVHRIVKSPSPVHTEESDHRQEYPHAHTGRPLDLERIEISDVGPAVTCLQEAQHIDGRLRLEHHRITQLDSEFVVNVTGVIVA